MSNARRNATKVRSQVSPLDAPYLAPVDSGDCATALDAWLTSLCTSGGTGWVPAGTYTVGAGVSAALSASCEIHCAPGAKFVAASGFPAARMFIITTGTGTNHRFKWRGGSFDGTLMPQSAPGQSNDVFSFNAENCTSLVLDFDEIVTGSDIGTGGGDSHVFVGGATNVDINVQRSVGAVDSGVYVSSSFNGLIGHSVKIRGNYELATTAAIVKRQFEVMDIDIACYQCQNGAAGGTADSTGGTIIPPGSPASIKVTAYRCDRPVSVQGMDGVQITAAIKELGLKTTAFTSTVPIGVYLSGSSNCNVNVTVADANPDLTVTSNFVGVKCDRRTIDVTDYDATDNFCIVNVSGIGKAFTEDANSASNYFVVKEVGTVAASSPAGTNSVMQRANPSASGVELTGPVVSLAGPRGSEALRVLAASSQVNFVQIVGAAAGAGSGVSIQAQGTDTDIPINLSSKGVSPILIGAPAGAETIRASKVASQVNSVEITGSATGGAVKVAARGADAAVDIELSGKGAGFVKLPSLTTAVPGTPGALYKDASGFVKVA